MIMNINIFDTAIFFAPFLIVGFLSILILFKRKKIWIFLKHGDVAKKIFLKKLVAINSFILIIGYLLIERIPYSRELGLIECHGIGFWINCSYNQKGWLIFLAIFILLIIGLILFLRSLKKNKNLKKYIAQHRI